MIEWVKEFETGSAILDKQHRLLIDNINLLKDLLDTPGLSKSEEEFSLFLVDYLDAYAKLHFATEERCMNAARCPVHALNSEEHQRFRHFIAEFKTHHKAGGFKRESLRNLHSFMRTWIVEHILKIDTQLRPCLQENNDQLMERT